MTANSGYSLSTSVGGSCPAGSWSGSTYTTGAITASCSVSFAAVAIPTVTGIMPTSGSITGGTVVDIAGTNFTNGATVSFGATAATVISTSPTSIRVTAPAHASGFADVTVTVSGVTSAASAADKFVYGTQHIYVSHQDPGSSNVYACTHSLNVTDGLSSCSAASSDHSLDNTAPTTIAITAAGTHQYAYVLDSDNQQIYACLIDPASALFTSCTLTSVSVSTAAFYGLNFATFGGTQYAYLAGYDSGGGGGVLFKCTINSSTGDLTSCATAASGTPPWNGNSVSLLQDIVFQTLNGVPYAYISDNAHGGGSGAAIYQCQMQSDGGINGSTCAATSQLSGSSSPAKMAIVSMGGTLYNYFGQTNAGGVAGNCAIDNATGDFTACHFSSATPLASNDAIAIAEVSGQSIAYFADSDGSHYPYYCPFNGSSSDYTIDASNCVQLTTGGLGGLDLRGVSGGVIGFIAN